MAIKYKLYQNKSKNSQFKDKWYALSVMTGTTDLNTIAERIERNCTAKKSDVLAVLTELVEVLRDELRSSRIVKINGLGSFRISIKSKLADTKEAFSIAKNFKGFQVRFQPEVSGRTAKGQHRNRVLVDGLTLEPWNAKDGAKSTASTTQPGA